MSARKPSSPPRRRSWLSQAIDSIAAAALALGVLYLLGHPWA